MGRTKEIWKDIPDYEEYYQVSNYGRVRSKDRTIKSKDGYYQNFKSKILNLYISNVGYCLYKLYKNGFGKAYSAHALVAMAFLDHTPCGYKLVVDHIDRNKKNNKLTNLKLISHRENTSKGIRKRKKSSKYVGVAFFKPTQTWVSAISIEKKIIYLGHFICESGASLIYQKALQNINNYKGSAKQFRELLKGLK